MLDEIRFADQISWYDRWVGIVYLMFHASESKNILNIFEYFEHFYHWNRETISIVPVVFLMSDLYDTVHKLHCILFRVNGRDYQIPLFNVYISIVHRLIVKIPSNELSMAHKQIRNVSDFSFQYCIIFSFTFPQDKI